MAVKTITIKEDVYKELVKLKRENESFSDLLERLLKNRTSLLKYFKGILKDSKFLDEIEKEILEERKKFMTRI